MFGLKGPHHHLIKEACKGNQASLRQVYDLLFDNVALTISSFGLSIEESEDLVQEAFIKIFKQLDRYNHRKSSLNTWSALIARGLAIKHISKNRLNTSDISKAKIISVVSQSSHDHLEYDMIIDQVEQLPLQYKQVFVLSVIQDLDHAAISRQLGISTSTSRVYLTRAKTQLQKKLAHLRVSPNPKVKSV